MSSADTDDGIEDEVNDGEGEKRDDETNNCVENSIFSVSNLFAITTRKDVA